MRLYRAIPHNECVLTSDKRAFKDDTLALNNLNFRDEIYSHIMFSHMLERAYKQKILFSFTDDIDVACRLKQKYPDIYTDIGCIDIEVDEETSAFLIENEKIFFLKPAFRVKDWIDLATYYTDFSSDEISIVVNNLNYSRRIQLVNSLIFSRNGVLSLARTAREYVMVCRDESLNILTDIDIEKAKTKKKLYDFNLYMTNDIIQTDKLKTVNVMLNDLEKLEVSNILKVNLRKLLLECREDDISKMYNKE